jgi:serine/threonine protein kinase/WD40 repeat protein
MTTLSEPQLARCPRCGAELADHARYGFCSRCVAAVSLVEPEDDLPREEELLAVLPSSVLGAAPQARFGDYELLEEIARGGMGVVYRARQRSLNRIVAVKMLLFSGLANQESLRRFRAEAAAAAALDHPNIVRVLDVGEQEGQPFIAMEYVAGRNLAQIVTERSLVARKAAGYVQKLARAIEFAHQRGVLHRDLKPSNVLINAFDEPQLTDFGLARQLTDDSSLTVTGQVLGSPNFMPPEQAGLGTAHALLETPLARRSSIGFSAQTAESGGDKGGTDSPLRVGPRSDIYGLGAILYYLLTGRPPFQADSVLATLKSVVESEPVSPRQLNPSTPRDVETICLKCLEKEPSRRYATAAQLAADLDRFLIDEPVHARPVSRMEKAWRWCRRKPALATLGIVVLVLLLIVTFGTPVALIRINRARLAAERNLYAVDMTLASDALRDGDFGHVQELLKKHEPRSGAGDLRGFEWRYLRKASDQNAGVTHQLQGVSASRMFYDSRLIITGSTLYNFQEDLNQIRAWDLRTWAPLDLALPHEKISNWWWFPDEQTAIAVDASEATIALYHLPSFEKGAVIRLPGKAMQAAASRDLHTLAAAFQDGKIQRVLLWNLATNSRLGILGEFKGDLSELKFSPDGKVLLGESAQWEITLWSTADGNALASPGNDLLGKTGNSYRTPFFAPRAPQLFLNRGNNKDLLVWDWSTAKLSTVYQADLGGVQAYGFSPDGVILATAWHGEVVVLLDTRDFRAIGTLRGHSGLIISLVFSPTGRFIATASRDHTAKLWDPKTQRELATLGGNEQKVSAVAFTPDERSVLTLDGDGKIKVWDLATLLTQGIFCGTTNVYGDFALSADERVLATTDGSIHFWDLATRREFESISLNEPIPCGIAFSPTKPLLAWVGAKSLGTVDYQSGHTNALVLEGNDNLFHPVAFCPDGREFLLGVSTNILACEAATLKLRAFARGEKQVLVMAISPDGSLLATGHDGGGLSLWNRISGTKIGEIPGASAHAPGVLDVEFSRDSRSLASAGADATGKIWEVAADGLKLRRTLRGHLGYMFGLQFSPDGRRAVSCGSDHTVKLWDIQTGLEVGTLYGHRGLVHEVTFSRDGNLIYSAGQDCEVRTWQAPPFDHHDAPGSPKASGNP